MTDKFIATFSKMKGEIPMLRMLSNMGVQDNEKQVSLRESLGSELEESLAKVEKNDATYVVVFSEISIVSLLYHWNIQVRRSQGYFLRPLQKIYQR